MVIDNTVDYIHHISSKKKTVSKWQVPGSLMVLLAITLALQTVAGHSDSLQDPEGCYQRMLQWLDGRDENKNATLLAMVLGMTISSSLESGSKRPRSMALRRRLAGGARPRRAPLMPIHRRARGSPQPRDLPADLQPAAQGRFRGRN